MTKKTAQHDTKKQQLVQFILTSKKPELYLFCFHAAPPPPKLQRERPQGARHGDGRRLQDGHAGRGRVRRTRTRGDWGTSAS